MPIGMALRAMLGAAGIPGELYLYNEGAGADFWVMGYNDDPSILSKEPDHLLHDTSNAAFNLWEGAWVIDSAVDLTPFTTLYVDWASVGRGVGVDNAAGLAIATSKNGKLYDSDYVTGIRRSELATQWSRQVEVLDVSALSGNYYVRTHVIGGGGGSWEMEVILHVYKVWLV